MTRTGRSGQALWAFARPANGAAAIAANSIRREHPIPAMTSSLTLAPI
jgi:hypothetical protein